MEDYERMNLHEITDSIYEHDDRINAINDKIVDIQNEIQDGHKAIGCLINDSNKDDRKAHCLPSRTVQKIRTRMNGCIERSHELEHQRDLLLSIKDRKIAREVERWGQ